MIRVASFEHTQQLIDIMVLSLLNRPEMRESFAHFDTFSGKFLVLFLQFVKGEPRVVVVTGLFVEVLDLLS
jgi:hypothetical protein